jgi:hypothetical protein
MAENWRLAGTYFESCNCDTACPCVFLSDPTNDDCTVLVAWHIDKGNYGGMSLDGLNVALAAYVAGNMVKNKWRASAYFDDRASEAQTNALHQIFSGKAGGHPAVLMSLVGELVGAASVPIEFRAEGKKHSVRVGKVGQSTIEAIQGQDGTEVKVSNHPLAVAPGYAAVASRSEKTSFHDHGLDLEASGKNGFYSPFVYQGS